MDAQDNPDNPQHRPHPHAFGQDQRKPGERRTLWVIALTAVTMVVEIVAGIVYGSMALLADGLHMASHASALGISAFAYIYARRHAHDSSFSFGTGKVNSLAAFAGAVLLAVHTLSGGQRQLVCLMAILAMGPRLIVMDEPFAGLDIPTALQLRRTLGALEATTNTATTTCVPPTST